MDRVPPTEPFARLMRAVLPYLLAGAAVSVGVLLRLLLARVLGAELPFITLFPVVFVVAYFLGFGPTVLATALGIVAAVELFMESRHGLEVAESVAQLGALLFGLTGEPNNSPSPSPHDKATFCPLVPVLDGGFSTDVAVIDSDTGKVVRIVHCTSVTWVDDGS